MMKWPFLFVCSASVLLFGCTSTVHPPQSAVSKIPMSSQGETDLHPENQEAFNMDMAAEAAVSQGCVSAWRKSLHGDEKGAMAELDELDHQYPKMVTIIFMRAQILEHLGKKEEAIKYYKQAVDSKEFSMVHMFKLAEALRTTGKADEALPYLRKLVKSNPDYVPFKLALAKDLIAIDKKSAEGEKQLEEIGELTKDGSEAKSAAEAKALLSEMRSTVHSAR